MPVSPKFTIKDVDKGWKKLADTLKSLQGGESYVKVGLLGDKAAATEHDAPLTNVALAAIHEFGTAELPSRSFIRRGFDENHNRYVEQLTPLVRAIYEGRVTVDKALNLMGMKIKWDMKHLILDGKIEPPDSPATFARKAAKTYRGAAPGEPVTLVDTGRMVAAIDHQVVLGGQAAGIQTQKGSATIVSEEE